MLKRSLAIPQSRQAVKENSCSPGLVQLCLASIEMYLEFSIAWKTKTLCCWMSVKVRLGSYCEPNNTSQTTVWVSHPHADHHLGILRLLAERHNLVDDPLVLIAPKNLLLFLEEYEQVDSQIVGSYIFLDSQSLTKETQQQLTLNSAVGNDTQGNLMAKLQDELGITSFAAIPVTHCRDT